MKLNISSGNAKWIFEYQNMWMNIKAQLFEKLSEVFARDRKNSECKLDSWQDEIKTTFHDKLVSCDMYGQKNWLSIHSGSKPVSAGVLPECKYKLREPEVFYRGAIFVKIFSIDQAGIWKEVNKDEKHGWRCYREQKSWIYPVKTLWKQKISTKLSTMLNTSIRRSYLVVTLQHVFDV